MMKVLVILLLASPFLPTTETRRRRSSSYLPGAMSHLSRHFFSRIRARNQHQEEGQPQITLGARQKKEHVPYHQFVHRKQGQEVQQKQIHWNRSNRKIEDSQRDQTQLLFSKIKKDLFQTIKTLDKDLKGVKHRERRAENIKQAENNVDEKPTPICPVSIKSLWCKLKKLEGAIDNAGYFIRGY